jgi:hypothetical protein
MSVRVLIAVVLAGFGISLVAQPGRTELAPQYTSWQDFAAVAALKQIPDLIGVVDRIERVEFGRFIVHGGRCRIEVTVLREGTRGGDGRPMPGPSHVASVNVGDKRCD